MHSALSDYKNTLYGKDLCLEVMFGSQRGQMLVFGMFLERATITTAFAEVFYHPLSYKIYLGLMNIPKTSI